MRPKAVGSKLISGAGKWAVEYAEFGHPSFCTVVDGSCLLQVNGQKAITLEAGDFVLLPTTPGFVLSSFEPVTPYFIDPRIPTAPVDWVRHGDPNGEGNVTLLGGYFEFESPDNDLLATLMPAMLHIRGIERLSTLVQLVGSEAKGQRPGRDLVLERLVEILLIESLRSCQGLDASPGLLQGLGEARLAEVLRQIHSEPSESWSVNRMAALAALSRSAFFDLFSVKMGMSPMRYLLMLRMALAKSLLRGKGFSLDEVAHRVGYSSASTFSMAFSRYVGASPGRYARDSA